MSDLTLYRVAEDFRSMVELRAQMQELGEDTGPLDQQIAEYFSQDFTRDKIDNVIGYYRHCKMLEAEAVEEKKRVTKLLNSWHDRSEWLLDLCMGAMEITGQKKLEGKTRGYLLLKGNGGLQKLNVADASLLPEDLVEYKGTISGPVWSLILNKMDEYVHHGEIVHGVQMERIPHDGRIRAALELKCDHCQGNGCVSINAWGGEPYSDAPCPACEGTGKNRVPGARLEPRGSSVIVK